MYVKNEPQGVDFFWPYCSLICRERPKVMHIYAMFYSGQQFTRRTTPFQMRPVASGLL